MKELKAIIQAYDAGVAAGRKMVLGAVVHLDGSSYRRPGARMLVDDLGRMTGAISGGCLEGDALRKALSAISEQKSRLVTYDTSDEEDAEIGAQLGCAGIIQVLFEPIDPSDAHNPIHLLKKALAKRQACVLMTIFNLNERNNIQFGTCALLEADGTITGEIPVEYIKNQVIAVARKALEDKTSGFVYYTFELSACTVFLEYIAPPVAMIVFGAGNDVIPLVNIADELGWETTVIDGRSQLAKPERFIPACQVMVSKPERALDRISIDERTVFLLMTHNYQYDLAMLKSLINKEITYIGLLGPKKKLHKMLEELKSEGIELEQTQLDRIYAPVGLEIGAETAEEIAVSIIAEIKAVLTGNPGGMLKNKTEAIHARSKIQTFEKKL